MATLDNEGYALNYVSVGEHTGTHWGAPAHFNEGEAAAHELNPEDFFLPGALIDIQTQAERDDDYAVDVDDLEAWEAEHGPFPAECAVIANTGWHKRWPTERYTNPTPTGSRAIPASPPPRSSGCSTTACSAAEARWGRTRSARTSALNRPGVGLRGRVARTLVDEPVDDTGRPAALPAGIAEVVILDDVPNVNLCLRVHALGNPEATAHVKYDCLAVQTPSGSGSARPGYTIPNNAQPVPLQDLPPLPPRRLPPLPPVREPHEQRPNP